MNLDDAFGQHSPSTRFLVPIQRFFNNSFLPTGTQSFGRNLKNFKVSRSVSPGAVISPPPSINHRSEIIRQLAPGFSARIPRSGGVRRIVTHFARLGLERELALDHVDTAPSMARGNGRIVLFRTGLPSTRQCTRSRKLPWREIRVINANAPPAKCGLQFLIGHVAFLIAIRVQDI